MKKGYFVLVGIETLDKGEESEVTGVRVAQFMQERFMFPDNFKNVAGPSTGGLLTPEDWKKFDDHPLEELVQGFNEVYDEKEFMHHLVYMGTCRDFPELLGRQLLMNGERYLGQVVEVIYADRTTEGLLVRPSLTGLAEMPLGACTYRPPEFEVYEEDDEEDEPWRQKGEGW